MSSGLPQTQGITPFLSDRFLSYLDAKPKTVATYARSLRPLFAYLAARQITRPTREDLLAYRDDLRARHKAATVQSYLTAARLFFRWAQQQGLYPDIAEHIKGASLQRLHRRDALTPDQIKALLASVPRAAPEGLRDYALIALMTTCGLRAIEAVRADVRDLRPLGRDTVLYLQGKGEDDRAELVKIPAPLELSLRAYLAALPVHPPNAPLFVSLSHRNFAQRLSTRSVSRIVKNRLLAVGLTSDRLCAHSLRHTAATLNLLSGGTLEETQQLLRHQNLNTTMVYLHHLSRAANMSEQRIADVIF